MADEVVDALAQAASGAVRGQVFLDRFVAAAGGEKRWQENNNGSYADLWRVELIRRLGTGETKTCPHLVAADPSYWVPYRPELLRCADCMVALAREVNGTPADDVCDHCGGVDETDMHPMCLQIPGGVMPLDGRLVAIGPVSITGGLCERCFRRDPHIPDDAGRGRRRTK